MPAPPRSPSLRLVSWLSAGIGHFTLLDPALVTAADIGNNFFLTRESLGQPRAREATQYLLELNGDVKGQARLDSLASLLADDALARDFVARHSLVLAVNVDPTVGRRLAKLAWEEKVPLIKVVTCGFYGSLRVQVNELTS